MRGLTRGLAAILCWLAISAAPASAGQLGLSAERIDFGSMKEGLVAERTVTLSNPGPAPVTIKNVSTS